jgi:hypothetical protein
MREKNNDRSNNEWVKNLCKFFLTLQCMTYEIYLKAGIFSLRKKTEN